MIITFICIISFLNNLTALGKHKLGTGHEFDYKILDTEQNKKKSIVGKAAVIFNT